MGQLRLVRVAHVVAPLVLVVQTMAGVSFTPLWLVLIIRIGVPREPCGDHRKGKQQDEPGYGVEQHAKYGQLDDPEHRRDRARRHPARHQPAGYTLLAAQVSTPGTASPPAQPVAPAVPHLAERPVVACPPA